MRGDQHPPAVGDQMTDQVRDRVALTRAGRPLHRHAPGTGEPDGDALLLVVRGQRHEQPFPDRIPTVVPPAPALAVTVTVTVTDRHRAVAFLRHDRGERLREGVGLGEHLAQLGVEAPVQRRARPDEQHPRVDQHRRRGRDRHRRAGCHVRVKAEGRDGLGVHLGQTALEPRIGRACPHPLPQCRELLERGEPQALQRVGLH